MFDDDQHHIPVFSLYRQDILELGILVQLVSGSLIETCSAIMKIPFSSDTI